MIKYAIALCVISFCHSELLRESGSYTELILSQHFSITSFFYKYYPNVMPNTEDYLKCLACHRAIFDGKQWILNGLWPYHSNYKFMSYCIDSSGNELSLSPSLLNENLKEELKVKWPMISIDGDEESEWTMDYNDSGSCVTEKPISYFQEGIRLLDKYNAGIILGNAGIHPGSEYDLSRIINAFTSTLKTEVFVKCVASEIYDKQYLLEVRICFDRGHNLQNCQHRLLDGDMDLCSSDKQVHYPLVPEGYL